MTADAILALDVGEVRVGVALANPIARIASPLTTLQNNEQLIDGINKLVQENQVGTVVVGLPRGLEGQETAQTEKIRQFNAELQEKTGLTTVLQDEAVTSVLAEDHLKKTKKTYTKEDIDMYAAAQILQDYLDNQLVRKVA